MAHNSLRFMTSSALAMAAAMNASAGSAQQATATKAVGDEIIVTGTRQINRTVTESLAPIDVLSAKDLLPSGKQSVRDLLGTLVPSINVSNSGAGASFAVKTLSLRGLASDQLLVLVNGKRRHNTATIFINGTTQNGQSPADLDLIPTSSVGRIEVLRDGASAQYGSDAIAGVVNVILKDTLGVSGLFQAGATGRGDGETGTAQFSAGFKLGDGGHLSIAADGRLQERTLRGRSFIGALYFPINGQPNPLDLTANRNVNKPGQPQVAAYNFSYDAKLPISEDVELYSFSTFSRREANSWLTFRAPNATNNIIEVYPDGYIPKLFIRDKDYQVAAGLRGALGAGFRFDLSTTYSRNYVDYDQTTSLNASLGPGAPTDYYIGSLKGTEWTSNLDISHEFDLGLAEALFVAVGAEYRENGFSIIAGEPASYIDGGYRSPPGQPLAGVIRQAGSQGVSGFPPQAAGDFKRDNISGYVNIEQKIVEGFDIGLAGRYERYSDFGSTTTGKASVRVEPIDGIAVRGTASTGFRAPTLQQQFYASSSTIGVLLPGATVTTLAPVRALPVGDPVAVALGAQPLTPERSTNYSLGVVFTPTSRFNLTVDAYQISIRDRILLGGTLTGAANAAGVLNGVGRLLQSGGLNPFQSGFYFSNAASTRTRGLDIVGTWRADLGGAGRATFGFSGNFNKTIFTRLIVPAQLSGIGLSLIDRQRQGDFTQGTPRDKFIASVNWELGEFTTNFRATRFGRVTQVTLLEANDDPVKPQIILDLDIAWAVGQGMRLNAGANNLLNKFPSILKPANQGTTGFAYYNTYAPYGISGGYYYAGLSFDF